MIAQAPTTLLTRHRFTVAEYHRLIEAGIFQEDDRLELINGEIIDMSPINVRHSGHVKRLNQLFSKRLTQQTIISVQDPVEFEDGSEPQPDIALLKPRADVYTQSNPTPADVLLIVEVADTSLEYDRTVKAVLYASVNIIEYWIVNLRENCLEVFREPTPTGYRQQTQFRRDDALNLLAFPEVSVAASEILD